MKICLTQNLKAFNSDGTTASLPDRNCSILQPFLPISSNSVVTDPLSLPIQAWPGLNMAVTGNSCSTREMNGGQLCRPNCDETRSSGVGPNMDVGMAGKSVDMEPAIPIRTSSSRGPAQTSAQTRSTSFQYTTRQNLRSLRWAAENVPTPDSLSRPGHSCRSDGFLMTIT